MKINVKEEIVLEREIDVEDLLCVLKHESEIGSPGREGSTVRVDKNLLKDAALVIEKLLSNPEYDANAELVEENEKLKKQCKDLVELNEAALKTNSELLDKVKELEVEKQMLNKMLSRKSQYEPPKVSLDKTKEAKDKIEMVKLEIPNVPDFELMDALAGILLHGLAL